MVDVNLEQGERDTFAKVIATLGCQLTDGPTDTQNIERNGTLIGTIKQIQSAPDQKYQLTYSNNNDTYPVVASVLASKKGEAKAKDRINPLAMQFYGRQNHGVQDGIYVTNFADSLTAFYDVSGGTLYRVSDSASEKDTVKLAEQLAGGVVAAGKEPCKSVTAQDITTLTSLAAGPNGAASIDYTESGITQTVIYDIQQGGRFRGDKARILAIVEKPAGAQGYINQDALKQDYNIQLSSYEMTKKERKAAQQPSDQNTQSGSGNNNNNRTPMSDNAKHGMAGVALAGAAIAATTWASRTQRDRQEAAAMEGRPPERRGGMLQFMKVASVALATTALAVTLDASLNKGRAFESVKNTFSR